MLQVTRYTLQVIVSQKCHNQTPLVIGAYINVCIINELIQICTDLVILDIGRSTHSMHNVTESKNFINFV